jgi:hypothetical protein
MRVAKYTRMWQRHERRCVLTVLIAIAPLSAAACASTTTTTSAVIVRNESILLLPSLSAGEVGWCVLTREVALERGGCGATRARFPIIAQKLHASSQPREVGGLALTASYVAAVSIDGSSPLVTHAESVLPDGLRAVIWKIPGESEYGPKFPPTIVPLDSHGSPISQPERRDLPLIMEAPSISLQDPTNPPDGACALRTRGLPGLVAKAGRVVTELRAYNGLIGNAFMACAQTEYLLNNWPISASVLIDAKRPGRTPAPLPVMKPVPGRVGTFEAPGEEGPQVARRLPGAWLIVSRGKGLSQRLELLDHLRVVTSL